MNNFLLDKEFLKKLDKNRNKQIFARIFSISFQEDIIEEEITGMVTGGSINIDGTSAVRRTCSLTLAADMKDTKYHEANWGLNHKFRLEIGVQNTIDARYPDICWFKQGTFLTTSFSCSLNTTQYSISISGKDKMCLLNGDIGGKIAAAADDLSIIETEKEKFIEVDIDEDDYLPGKYWIMEYKSIGVLTINSEIIQSRSYYIKTNTQYQLINENNKNFVNELYKQTYKLDYNLNYNKNQQYYERDIIIEKEKNPIVSIIKELVHTYGNEPYSNIIINDLDENGYELLEYRGEKPLFLLQKVNSLMLQDDINIYNEYINITTNENMVCYKVNKRNITDDDINNDGTINFLKSEIQNSTILKNIKYTPLNNQLLEAVEIGDFICFDNKPNNVNSDIVKENLYIVSKISYGETIGYSLTDLVYAGVLKTSIGETITSILDKIVKQLIDYEYFYDLDGHFIFQKKSYSAERGFEQNALKFDIDNEQFVIQEQLMYKMPFEYNFQDNITITAFNNSTNLANLKNDFVVWGKRKTENGVDIPIHMRVAFDTKPISYKRIVLTEEDEAEIELIKEKQPEFYKRFQQQKEYEYNHPNMPLEIKVDNYDWREILYQMARDYYLYNEWEKFYEKIEEYNPSYKKGITGYEQYYTDIYSFWRDLYNPYPEIKFSPINEWILEQNKNVNQDGVPLYQNINNKLTLDQINIDCDFYLEGLNKNILGKEIYNLLKKEEYKDKKNELENTLCSDKYKYWNKNIIQAPYLLNFWFDFYEIGDLQKYSVKAIGDRIQVTNNDKIKAIYYQEVPNLIFMTKNDYNKLSTHMRKNNIYKYFFISEKSKDMFSISSKTLTAKNAISDAINTNSYITENISITALPVYYLQPNCCIRVIDKETHIDGYYNLTKITIPLTYNGTMSLTAAKINYSSSQIQE